jgi:hypothetical protein
MMAAIKFAISGAQITSTVWSAYVELYEAMTALMSASSRVDALPARHQYFAQDLAVLRGKLDDVLGPVDLHANEKARFLSSGRAYVFDGARRGRPIGMQEQIAHAAALVWLANCKLMPPSTLRRPVADIPRFETYAFYEHRLAACRSKLPTTDEWTFGFNPARCADLYSKPATDPAIFRQ